jgi:hypothetical protein
VVGPIPECHAPVEDDRWGWAPEGAGWGSGAA